MNAVTTILNGNAQSTRTVTYDSDNDVTQEKVTEWAFGVDGPAVSQTDITYTTIAGSFKRIAGKTLTAVNPATGSSTTQGKTEYFYDDYSVTNRGTSVPNSTHNTSASDRGNLTRVRAYTDAGNYIETQTHYDNLGNAIETIDSLSHSTTIDFTDNFTDNTTRNFYAR